MFKTGNDGPQGVLGGPHSAWLNAMNSTQFVSPRVFFTMEAKAYCLNRGWLRLNEGTFPKSVTLHEPATSVEPVPPDVDELCTNVHCDKHEREAGWIIPTNWNLVHTKYNIREIEKSFCDAEDLNTDVTYRCVSCRNCSQCRRGDQLEEISLKEEVEQALIEESITLKPEELRIEARLPFIADPLTELKPNRYIAEKILNS